METYLYYLKQLTKKELTNIAKLHHMSGYSACKKDELAQKLEAFLSSDKTAHHFFSYLGEDEIHLFLGKEASEDSFLTRRLREGGYCFIEKDGTYVFPKDLTIPLLSQEDFYLVQKKRSALLDCCDTAGYLYGSVPLSILQEMYLTYTGTTITEETIRDFLLTLPAYFNHFTLIGSLCVHTSFVENSLYEKIRLCQGGQSYYIPDHDSMLHMARYGFLPDSHVKKLLLYQKETLGLPADAANAQTSLLQAIFRQGGSLEDALDSLQKQFGAREFDSQQPNPEHSNPNCRDDSVFLSLCNEVFSHTRLLLNRGYTAPEYQTQKIHPKKIYPNSPCPCGSGKKYKKCCGRRK